MKLLDAFERFLQSGAGNRSIAVFDCDGTLIKGDIGESMFYHQVEHFLFRESPAALWPDCPERNRLAYLFHSLVRHPPYIRHRDTRHVDLADHLLSWYFSQIKEMKTEKACSDIVRLFSGFRLSEMEEIAAEVIKEEISSPIGERAVGSHLVRRGVRFIKETGELLLAVRRAGITPWIVSGSNLWSVQQIGRLLGVPTEHVIGVEIDLVHGAYSSTVKTPVPVGVGKVEALKAMGLPPPSIVVSDSIYDIPLLNYSSGLKVLVNSNEQSDHFFERAGFEPDQNWVTIDNPSYLPPITI